MELPIWIIAIAGCVRIALQVFEMVLRHRADKAFAVMEDKRNEGLENVDAAMRTFADPVRHIAEKYTGKDLSERDAEILTIAREHDEAEPVRTDG